MDIYKHDYNNNNNVFLAEIKPVIFISAVHVSL